MNEAKRIKVKADWDRATVREVPDATIGGKGLTELRPKELIGEIGRVAALADPMPPQATQDARNAFHRSLDPSNEILNDRLFLPPELQYRISVDE